MKEELTIINWDEIDTKNRWLILKYLEKKECITK